MSQNSSDPEKKWVIMNIIITDAKTTTWKRGQKEKICDWMNEMFKGLLITVNY